MAKKIVTVIGARPQFIKAAVVSHEIEKTAGLREVLVHTGQHFDYGMSQVFFDELDIPEPKYNLGISGGSNSSMTSRMMVELEAVFNTEKPDVVLVYGDTNSTLAAGLCAAKMGIPIAHVEAGPRSRSLLNAEEVNRVCVDHLSSVLFASTKSSMSNLAAEGLADRSLLVGDTMYDAFLNYSRLVDEWDHAPQFRLLDGRNLDLPNKYCYLTCHRAENTCNNNNLSEILFSAAQLSYPTIFPVHPRTRCHALEIVSRNRLTSIYLIDTVGYLESIYLTKHAEQVITDSGGLQREAFFAGVRCTVPLMLLAWPEIMVDGRCVLVNPDRDSITKALNRRQIIRDEYRPFGDGTASIKIANHLASFNGKVA